MGEMTRRVFIGAVIGGAIAFATKNRDLVLPSIENGAQSEHGLINMLDPRMKPKVLDIQRICREQGVETEVFSTYRTYQEQAVLYRETHSTAEVAQGVAELRSYGRDDYADILESTPPQPTRGGSAALISLHCFGLAADIRPMVNGEAIHELTPTHPEWQVLFGAMRAVGGLEVGADFNSPDIQHTELAGVSASQLLQSGYTFNPNA